MKKFLLLIMLSMFVFQANAQRVPSEKKMSIAAGVLQGGGGIVGADFEFMFSKHFSVQGGIGLTSFGAGVNYHFKPFINSSMISLMYWHQGIGNTFTEALLGPVYTYRAPKVFQFQIGLGAVVQEGPNIPESSKGMPMMLTYSIGVYFPL